MASNSIKKDSGRPLYHIFTRIPDRYDLINHVITLGMDSGWRRQAARVCLKEKPGRILDICCGTGDLAITIARLPFSDGHFDCIAISFAFRNLTYNNPLTSDYLNEILRVLKAGGRFVIVESSQPKSGFIRFLDHLYLKLWVFPTGYLISGDKESYHYLAESAEHFYSAEEMVEYLVKAGFKQATAKRLFFGAAAVYTATK